MPSVVENQAFWNGVYDWSKGGDEWSTWWGDVAMEWYITILPRIHAFVPAGTILEIAPGFGRWTQYLKDLCDALVVVDLAERCIDVCRQRFAGSSHISYHVNDGKSLAMVDDRSIDFVFSFDSLVHAEVDAMEPYAGELARVLKPEGVAFIHHSNFGAYPIYAALERRLQKHPTLLPLLVRLGILEPVLRHGRAPSVSAACFRRFASRAGLHCVSQELIQWGTRRLIDCLTVVARPDSKWARPTMIVRNDRFNREAGNAAQMAKLYSI